MIALALNVGSSSLKAALFNSNDNSLEEIDRFTAMDDDGDTVEQVFEWISSSGHRPPDVIGHRLVHGGGSFSSPVIIDNEVLRHLHDLKPWAPLHMPKALRVVERLKDHGLQVACFDTAFHRTLPRAAWDYSLPASLRERGLRKYGFHGLNCEHIVSVVDAEALHSAVIAHLGSGCSITAIADGKSVDTTMGFTPSGGVPMATRLGDIDPGLLLYLLREGYDATDLERIFNHESGLKGWSDGISNMADLLSSQTDAATFAIDAFCTRTAKAIAQMTTSLQGLETIIFTGGIGENSNAIRNNILKRLSFLGNLQTLVVPANEERVIAIHALDQRRFMHAQHV